MENKSSKHLSLVLILAIATLFQSSKVASQSAPAPASEGPANLTAILAKNGQFKTFLRLLTETQVGNQIQNQLNSSTSGMTVFAPTDNAFNNLKAGALNDLTNQQQVQLVLYHVLPQFLNFANLQTVSNPVRTQASGENGNWGLRFSAQNNQVNVSTGVVDTQIYNPLREEMPLAVYQVDKVLLPEELFGTKKPSAPAPEGSTKSSDKPKSKSNSTEATAGSPEGSLGSGNDNSASVKSAASLGLVLGLGVMAFVFS